LGDIGYSGAEEQQEEGGNVTIRPRAADDFATIRARMEELSRKRAQVSADQRQRLPIGPSPYHRAATGNFEHQRDRLLPRSIFRAFVRE
jgi:hypothetical protein